MSVAAASYLSCLESLGLDAQHVRSFVKIAHAGHKSLTLHFALFCVMFIVRNHHEKNF